jgi:hypothetical protein
VLLQRASSALNLSLPLRFLRLLPEKESSSIAKWISLSVHPPEAESGRACSGSLEAAGPARVRRGGAPSKWSKERWGHVLVLQQWRALSNRSSNKAVWDAQWLKQGSLEGAMNNSLGPNCKRGVPPYEFILCTWRKSACSEIFYPHVLYYPHHSYSPAQGPNDVA